MSKLTVYRCNRCFVTWDGDIGGVTHPPGAMEVVTIEHKSEFDDHDEDHHPLERREAHLCPKCAMAFVAFMKKKPGNGDD